MTPILKFISKQIPQRTADRLMSVRSILIVDLNFSGDVLMDSVAWKIVHDNMGVKPDCLTYNSSRPVAERNPHVHKVFTVSKSFFFTAISPPRMYQVQLALKRIHF